MVWKNHHKVKRFLFIKYKLTCIFIIRSRAKLAYEHAQEVIEGRDLPADVLLYGDQNPEYLSSDIRLLYDMSIHMGQRRKDSGSLSLHSVKLTFELDSEGVPISFGQAESKEANKLIEEFMLCANISVAEKIKSAYPQEALLRRHEKPIERRLVNRIHTFPLSLFLLTISEKKKKIERFSQPYRGTRP